jgi:hypothetical protein
VIYRLYFDEDEDVEEIHQDEELMHALPFDEFIFDAPTHEEVNTISCIPFQDLDDLILKRKKCKRRP